jgi:hypothetical protein
MIEWHTWTLGAVADGMYAIKAADGLLMAMRGYFDDSNTHSGAPFFMWAGLSGRKEQWDIAEPAWKVVLAERDLTYFHMAECESGGGPYGNRAERDLLIHDLRQTIIGNGLRGSGVAIPHADWNALITPELSYYYGGIGMATIAICIDKAIRICGAVDSDPIALFFDAGAHPRARLIIEDFGEAANDERSRVDSYAFLPVKSSPALQAADMLAWEFQNHVKIAMRDGLDAPTRPHFREWARLGLVADCTLFDRPCIEDMLAKDRVSHPEWFSGDVPEQFS